MAELDPTVTPTVYQVSCLPIDDINTPSFTVNVEYRGGGKWGVCRSRRCYDINGEADWESIPPEREDEWLARFRFDLDTALDIARRVAPTLRTNGLSVADVLKLIEDGCE